MRRHSQGLGLALIAFGVLFLLDASGRVHFDLAVVWRLWPLLLIVWGARIVGGRVVGTITSLVALLVVVLALMASSLHSSSRLLPHLDWNRKATEQTLQQSNGSTERLTYTLTEVLRNLSRPDRLRVLL